jgi:hypothetical protein
VIGLIFFAAIGVWIIVGYQLAPRVPRWLGIKTARGGSVATGVFLLVYTIGPFADHIVGMWQFQRLCERETSLQILPGAENATRGKQQGERINNLQGFVIPIYQIKSEIIDSDTQQVIARWNLFGTDGGRVKAYFGVFGVDQCSASGSKHPDSNQFGRLINRIKMTY